MYYIQVEVLEPRFHKLKEGLKDVRTVDDVIKLHSEFLDECLKETLLTDEKLFKTIMGINMRILYFCKVIIRFFVNV